MVSRLPRTSDNSNVCPGSEVEMNRHLRPQFFPSLKWNSHPLVTTQLSKAKGEDKDMIPSENEHEDKLKTFFKRNLITSNQKSVSV